MKLLISFFIIFFISSCEFKTTKNISQTFIEKKDKLKKEFEKNTSKNTNTYNNSNNSNNTNNTNNTNTFINNKILYVSGESEFFLLEKTNADENKYEFNLIKLKKINNNKDKFI